jgi:PAS domain-containing protein
MRASRNGPPIDVRFLTFQANKAAEDSTGSGGHMSALNRVVFEKHLTDAKKQIQHALIRQVGLWAELAEEKPDIARCHRLSSDMHKAITLAEDAFAKLLVLNAQSLVVLRLYTDFSMYVSNDQDKAQILIAETERIEEQQVKDFQRETGAVLRMMEQSNLDILADNTAIITIGGSNVDLGIMLNTSPHTSKLFGYSRWQMERRNISMLLPDPIAELHDSFLRHYLVTGEGRLVDYTRFVFGLHK